jgi:hypothetical protein
LLPKLAKLHEQTPNIKKIIYVEFKFRSNLKIEFHSNIELVTFSQLESSGQSASKDLIGISPTENDIALCVIQYTSGMKTEKFFQLKYEIYFIEKKSHFFIYKNVFEPNSGTKNLKNIHIFQ